MDKKTIVENGWMTDVAVACDNSVTMDSDLFKACVTSADVHELVWPDEESNGEDNGEAQAASIEDPVTPVVEETPAEEEETPVVEETPEEEETPAEDETPEEETPVVDPEDEE